ncbi:hypothetical protein CUMW_166880 [Citrus unshiu]|uniref:Uncharacterized protein n=1 Tax=Citrus unshiu TaxID=55188 RepID=A0A2H5PTX5_CITUN|nr:hypothetical protein CUMW_166880 [Citrus unshiu]
MLVRAAAHHSDQGRSGAYQPMLKGEEMDSVGLHYRGQSTILDVDKHFIMRRVRIHARYLRILGSMLLHPSTILGGEKCIKPIVTR